MLRWSTVLAAGLLGLLVNWVIPDPWKVWLCIASVFVFLLWHIGRLEDRIDDLEYALITRDREVFTEKQWKVINTQRARIYELIGYDPLADLKAGQVSRRKV
jgi:hypothetical protein